MTAQPRYARRTALAMLAAGASATLLLPAAGHASLPPRRGSGIFGFTDIRRTGSQRFPKWKGAIDRSLREREGLSKACTPTAARSCDWHGWQALLDGLRNKSRDEQIRVVNRELNRRAYVLDPINWGVSDYWASPAQFFRKNGDCEDFSIAKYMSLRD
ncbi:MAG: transglutaminase-like cysteine peptidase, partial [Alphaproteobacteria bacterium]|nr:transglutaminase-like cysteine peptidase [Alphaproteobacteria bacterium]